MATICVFERFCFSFLVLARLDLCQDDEYQCHVDGLCKPRKVVCDSNPDCQNQDDELNCAQNVCAEGTMKCGDDQCHVSCKDVIKTSTNLTGHTSDALKPLIEVVCVQSTHFSTTTTPTTTTTTTTPPPTTTTTTTTPPPTTTTKTTTPKITTPTTTTPITTTTATTTLATTTTPSTTTRPTTTETPPPATTASTLPSYEDTESLDFSSISEETTAHNVLGDIEHGKHQTSLDKPVNDKKSILTNPVALAGIIVGAVACVVITSLIIYAVRRRLKKKKSHDIPPSDLWIPSKGEPNELSPMNEIL